MDMRDERPSLFSLPNPANFTIRQSQLASISTPRPVAGYVSCHSSHNGLPSHL
jgi:hypothetical protein